MRLWNGLPGMILFQEKISKIQEMLRFAQHELCLKASFL
jgi:hypothetical protein